MRVWVRNTAFHIVWFYEPVFGGYGADTICRIKAGVDGPECTGAAVLAPTDQFRKETGRKISLARALKIAGFTKDERTTVWAAYHGRRKVTA